VRLEDRIGRVDVVAQPVVERDGELPAKAHVPGSGICGDGVQRNDVEAALDVADHTLEQAGIPARDAVQHQDASATIVPSVGTGNSKPIGQRERRRAQRPDLEHEHPLQQYELAILPARGATASFGPWPRWTTRP